MKINIGINRKVKKKGRNRIEHKCITGIEFETYPDSRQIMDYLNKHHPGWTATGWAMDLRDEN